MSSIRSVSGGIWVASASGQTVPDVGFVGRSEVSRELQIISNKPANPAFLGALQPAELHDVQCYPCPLTKCACCVLHPSPPPKLPCSATREAQSRPHNSELRTHRQLEHQEVRITRSVGILCEPLLTISTKLKSFLLLRTFGIGSPSKREETNRTNKMPDFKPKNPVQLAPPKDDPISLEELAKADGKQEQRC